MQTGELGVRVSAVDRQDRHVFGRGGLRIDEPLRERAWAAVPQHIDRHQRHLVVPSPAPVRPVVALGNRRGRCGQPDGLDPVAREGGASRRRRPEPADRPLHHPPQVRRDARPARGVESLDGPRQREGAGLDPILKGHVPGRDTLGERHDEPV
jgi:hypothetical protein